MSSEHPAVTRFREYVRIKTLQPNPDYESAVSWFQVQAKSLGLPIQVVRLSSGFPVVVITWEGSDKSLPTLLLNSHMDVVPVYPDKWTHEPFSADKDANGKIFGRGTQDMKCVGIWHLESVRQLKDAGFKPLRTIHMSYVPDEELLGHYGMKLFVQTPEFKALNVGYALDEGLCDPSDTVAFYYGERVCQWIKVTITGNPGHGSQFINGTAADKARKFIDRVMDYRSEQQKKLESTPGFYIGDVNTVNLNTWEGGVQMNVIPSDITLGVDFRVSPRSSLAELDSLLTKWFSESGGGFSLRYVQREDMAPTTPITEVCPFFKAFNGACKQTGCKIRPEIFPAATDSRYFRSLGIKALGFTPAAKTPILLHDHDEYMEESVFLLGLKTMEAVVKALASVNAK